MKDKIHLFILSLYKTPVNSQKAYFLLIHKQPLSLFLLEFHFICYFSIIKEQSFIYRKDYHRNRINF